MVHAMRCHQFVGHRLHLRGYSLQVNCLAPTIIEYVNTFTHTVLANVQKRIMCLLNLVFLHFMVPEMPRYVTHFCVCVQFNNTMNKSNKNITMKLQPSHTMPPCIPVTPQFKPSFFFSHHSFVMSLVLRIILQVLLSVSLIIKSFYIF